MNIIYKCHFGAVQRLLSSETSSKRVDAFMIVTCLLASCISHCGVRMHFYFSILVYVDI